MLTRQPISLNHASILSALVLLLLLLIGSKTSGQVMNPDHVGVIGNGYGAPPYLAQASTVFVQGSFAYVGGDNAFEIVDITLPGAPVHKGSLLFSDDPAFGSVKSIFVAGKYAYLLCGGSDSFVIVDVSNPAAPKRVGILYFPVNFLAYGGKVVASGNYAYLVSGIVADAQTAEDIFIIDITNPASPVEKTNSSKISIQGGNSLPIYPKDIFISGNNAYVTCFKSDVMEVFNLSNPTSPQAIKNLKLSDLQFVNDSKQKIVNPISIFVAPYPASKPNSLRAYILDDVGSMCVLDVTQPSSPVALNAISNGTGGALLSKPVSISVAGNYAYVVGGSNALEIMDISNVTSTNAPVHKASVVNADGIPLNDPRSIVVSGNYAYIASTGSSALEIVDITSPTAPLHKGSLTTASNQAKIVGCRSVAISGNYAYLESNGANCVEVVDCSNPANPVHVTTVNHGDGGASLNAPSDIAISGKYAYIVNNADQSGTQAVLQVLDISNPTNPNPVGKLLSAFPGSAIAAAGNYAYLTTKNSSGYLVFEVIDISNPSTPAIAGTYTSTIAYAPVYPNYHRIFVSGNYAYVAAGSFLIFDITNKTSPNLVKTCSLSGANGVYVSGKYAYVTCSGGPGDGQLAIFDVSNPASTSCTYTFFKTNLNQAFSVAVKNNYALIVNNLGYSLEVVDVSTPSSPKHYSLLNNYGVNSPAGKVNLALANGITISGNYAYVVTNAGYMEILDLYSSKVSGFTPVTGNEGTAVTISGQNFDSYLQAFFNGLAAKVTSVSAQQAIVEVPTGATIGKISVTNHGVVQSSSNFLVIPKSAAATAVQQTSFTANWSDVGASTYYLDVSSDNFTTYVTGYKNFNTGNTLSAVVSGLSPGTAYQYRVRSSDGTGSSGNSSTIATNTLPVTPTASDATQVSQSGFTANWSASSGASGYFLDVAYDNAFSNFVVGYNNLSVIGTSQIVSGLNPYTTCYYRVRSASASGSSASSSVITVVTLDVVPPAISTSSTPNPSSVTLGNTPSLNTIVTDNVRVDTVQLFYRGIAEHTFKKAAMQGPGGTGGNYSITVQTGWYDSLGMEYYFRGVDAAGNATVSASGFIQLVTPSLALPALPSGTKQSDYRIIAFPYQLATDNKVTTVYSGVPWNDNTKAAMWWWNASSQDGQGLYDQYGSANAFQTVDPGKGYWAITSTSFTPQIANVPAPKYNRTNLFSLTLKPNWNEIGNPYPVAISWDDVIAFNQKNNITAFSALTIYDGTGYKTATGSVMLKPFEGGFVKNLSSSDITIQIPFPGQTTIGGRRASIGTDLTEAAWNIFLHITQGEFTNQLGGFGMHPEAQSGPDRYDQFNPPAFQESPEVSFRNAEYPMAAFSNDMVAPQEKYRWQFTPHGRAGEQAVLNWSPDLRSSGKPLFLLDEQNLTVLDMSQVNTYSFQLTNESRFSIFYGSENAREVLLPEILATDPYPNPLNGDSEASIHLNLPDATTPYHIVLQVFNNKGESMGTREALLSAGIQVFAFRLPESQPAGMYFYKLSITHEKSSACFTGKLIKL